MQRHQQLALAEGPGDRDSPLDVGVGVAVVLEVVFGPGEVVQGLETRRELGVRKKGENGLCLLPVPSGNLDLACDRLGEAQCRCGQCDQRCVAHFLCGRERLAAHLDRLLEVSLVKPVDGEFDLAIIDLDLPPAHGIAEDGWDLVRILRAADPALLMVLIAAECQPDTQTEALRYGVANLLEKPISPRELRTIVRTLRPETSPV